MKPRAIYLIRHGESEGNIDEGIYKRVPDWQINLTKKGERQAQEAGKKLLDDVQAELSKVTFDDKVNETLRRISRPPIMFYVSSLNRARQTAKIINGFFNAEMREDPRLREQEFGNYAEPKFIKKIARERKKFSIFYYRIPMGESGADLYDRQTTVLETLHRDFAKEDFPHTAGIVSHGLTMKAFLMRWYHWPAEDFDGYKTPKNCEIIKMQLNEKGKYDLITPLIRRPNE
jgi:broad specificity phosphatase PhoE